jgi:hypothetical protein
MDIAKQFIRRNLDSSYLQHQTDTLTKACDALLMFNNRERGYLTDPQRLVLKETWQVLSALKVNHLYAFETVQAHEKEAYLVTDKANSLLEVKSAGLDVAGKVALLGHVYPPLMKRGQLTMETNAVDLMGERFQSALANMAHAAFELSNEQAITINAAVDQKWSRFESERASLEKELFVRTQAYEKQLARIAKRAP